MLTSIPDYVHAFLPTHAHTLTHIVYTYMAFLVVTDHRFRERR